MAAYVTTKNEIASKVKINPFKNRTDYATQKLTIGEILKMILMTVSGISIIRTILFLVLAIVSSLWIILLMIGYSPRDKNGKLKDMSKLRRTLLFIPQVHARLALLVLGYIWISEKLPPEDSKSCFFWPTYFERPTAPKIFVFNHVSFVDAIYLLSRTVPSVVAQANIVKMPFVGWAITALCPVLVPVTEQQRQELPSAGDLLQERAASTHFNRPVTIFPEGTTTQASTIIRFQEGAFKPLVPIQPVVLKYGRPLSATYPLSPNEENPNFSALECNHGCGCDSSWTIGTNLIWLVFRMCCQFTNSLSVEFLSVVDPRSADIIESYKEISKNDANGSTSNQSKVVRDQTPPPAQLEMHGNLSKTSNVVTECLTVSQFTEVVTFLFIQRGFIYSSLSVSDNYFLKAFIFDIDYVCDILYENGRYNSSKYRKLTGLTLDESIKVVKKFMAIDEKKTGRLNEQQLDRFVPIADTAQNKLFPALSVGGADVSFGQFINAWGLLVSNSNEILNNNDSAAREGDGTNTGQIRNLLELIAALGVDESRSDRKDQALLRLREAVLTPSIKDQTEPKVSTKSYFFKPFSYDKIYVGKGTGTSNNDSPA